MFEFDLQQQNMQNKQINFLFVEHDKLCKRPCKEQNYCFHKEQNYLLFPQRTKNKLRLKLHGTILEEKPIGLDPKKRKVKKENSWF